MITRYLLVALVAGLLAGVLATVAQHARVVPLILEAEKYETAPDAAHDHSSALDLGLFTPAQAHEHAAEGEDEGGMLFGVDRLTGTLMANLVTGTGFALILMAASLLSGRSVTLANGAVWGVLGWLVFQMAPALGLPPELPGFPAGDLMARQIWWVGCAAATAGALALFLLRPEIWAKAFGVVLMLAPHAIGAPQPEDVSTSVPALLAAEYASAALATGLFFWVMIGLGIGALNQRYVDRAA
ncbi:CbtA family protein [Rhizobium sp. FKL33]|uniref:CbtA family protein n=1 Tax=Rhizobium sp. FKL33 TaxID=2562307 RepID=UPI0010C05F58|nr:CbtA family protein [Rhizobium sp. FKL33]